LHSTPLHINHRKINNGVDAYRAYTREIANEHTHIIIIFYFIMCSVCTILLLYWSYCVSIRSARPCIYWTYVSRLKRHRHVIVMGCKRRTRRDNYSPYRLSHNIVMTADRRRRKRDGVVGRI